MLEPTTHAKDRGPISKPHTAKLTPASGIVNIMEFHRRVCDTRRIRSNYNLEGESCFAIVKKSKEISLHYRNSKSYTIHCSTKGNQYALLP